MRARFIAGAAVVAAGAIGGCGATGFCASHRCVGDFSHQHGSVVECVDGTWSHLGGLPGACSDHGGERGGGGESGTDTGGLSGGAASGGGPRNGSGLSGTFGGG